MTNDTADLLIRNGAQECTCADGRTILNNKPE